MPAAADRVHATAIVVGSAAVLIRGSSGSGKSDLALRCLAVSPTRLLPASAQLVTDDQAILTREGDVLTVSAPPVLAGLIEVRGVGILSVPSVPSAVVRLVADLVPPSEIERHPDPAPPVTLCGVAVPHLRIAPFEHSAPIKLLLALSRLG